MKSFNLIYVVFDLYLPTSCFYFPSRSSISSTVSVTSSTSSKSSSKSKNWVFQRLSKILSRDENQESKKGGLKDFLSSLWGSPTLSSLVVVKKKVRHGESQPKFIWLQEEAAILNPPHPQKKCKITFSSFYKFKHLFGISIHQLITS